MITCRYSDLSHSFGSTPWRWAFHITCNREEEFTEIHEWCHENLEPTSYYAVRMLMIVYMRTQDAAFAFRMRWC